MNKLSLTRHTRTPTEAAEEVLEIDVTPVMNMFVILIPFLVSVAVFTQLSIIEFTLPPNVGEDLSPSSKKPVPKLTVVVAPNHLLVTLGEKQLDSLAAPRGRYAFDALRRALETIRAEIEVSDNAIIASRDSIRFKHVIGAMDACREAGFEKIGLSSATFQPKEGI